MLKELSLIDMAMDIAMDVHSNQVRKTSKLPYFIHPYRTYIIAKELRLNKKQQILAILHDTYEDGKNKDLILKFIRSRFGEEMVTYVKILSHDKNIKYNEYLYKLSKTYKEAFEVKLCDMIDNLIDSPSKDQKNKYSLAIKYLLDNGITIDNKFLVKLEYLFK